MTELTKLTSFLASQFLRTALTITIIGFAVHYRPCVAEAQTQHKKVVAVTHNPIPLEKQLWHKTIITLPVPSKGCYKATYPDLQWTPIACGTSPVKGWFTPRKNTKIVGGRGDDFAAQVQDRGTIALAEGSFDKVTVTGETNVSVDGTATRMDEFSLQLNTNQFNSPLCKTSPNKMFPNKAPCRGWEQFVLGNDPGSPPAILFIQYWLLDFGSPCPNGWTSDSPNCVFTTKPVNILVQNIQSLVALSMIAEVDASGTDTVMISGTGESVVALSSESLLTLAPNWTTAEFNVFGDLTRHQAVFNPGTSLVVRTHVNIVNGSTSTPVPVLVQMTGETNSLDLARPACSSANPFNAITFGESNVSGAGYAYPQVPPPVNLCQDAEQLVAYEQKALANAQAARTTALAGAKHCSFARRGSRLFSRRWELLRLRRPRTAVSDLSVDANRPKRFTDLGRRRSSACLSHCGRSWEHRAKAQRKCNQQRVQLRVRVSMRRDSKAERELAFVT